MRNPRPGFTTAMSGVMLAIGGGLGWSILPPLMPLIAGDISMSYAMGGLVWGASAFGCAFASPFGGAAADRLGVRSVAGVAMLIGALACAGRAIAGDAWFLAITMLVFGLHTGFVRPTISKALAEHVPAEHLGRANGITLFCATMGISITAFTSRTVLEPMFGGWRPLMVVASGAIALMGMLWLLLVRDRVSLLGHTGFGHVMGLAKDRQLLRVGIMHFLLFGSYVGLFGILPRLLTDWGMPPKTVSIAVSLWLALFGLANLAGPWFSDCVKKRRPFLIFGSMLTGVLLAAMAFSPTGASIWLLFGAALGSGCVASLLFVLPIELPGIGPKKAGGALGLMGLTGQLGAFLLSLLTGGAAQCGGLSLALIVLALTHLAILFPMHGLRETGHFNSLKS